MNSRNIFAFILLASAALVTGCVGQPKGGTGTNGSEMSGSASMTLFAPKDAVAALGDMPYVVLTDFANACSLGNDLKANSQDLVFAFMQSKQFAVGTTAIGPGLDAQYAVYDKTCNSPSGASADSGSVTISAVTSTDVIGTFDIMLSGKQVSGSFSAALCAVVADGGAGSCR